MRSITSPARAQLRRISALILAASASLLISCGGSDGGGGTTEPEEPQPVSGVVDPANVQLDVGDTFQMRVLVSYDDGSVRTFTSSVGGSWTSSNPSVVTITNSGLMTAVGPGTSTITARAEGRTGTATVTVRQLPVQRVEVDPSAAELEVGATGTLTATTLDANGNEVTGRTISWSSSDPAIATVASDGTVTGVAPGAVTVTAESEGRTGVSSITVVPATVASVTIDPAQAIVQLARTTTLTATAFDARGSELADRTVAWSSDDTGIVIVDDAGVVTAVGIGAATVRAVVEGVAGTAEMTVVPRPVAAVEVSPPTSTIAAGTTTQLTATTRDSDGGLLSGREIVWTSSDPIVASVSGTGLVTGGSGGTVTITASSEGVEGTATVSVTVPVASVEVAPNTVDLAPGETTRLTATPRDAAGNVLTDRNVEWVSIDPSVATVDDAGLVTGLTGGTTSIVATSEEVQGVATVTVTPPVATIEISPAATNVDIGGTRQLDAILRDQDGNVLTGRSVVWSSTNGGVASVDQSGVVTGVSLGLVSVVATSEGVVGVAAVAVVDPRPDLRPAEELSAGSATFVDGEPILVGDINVENIGTVNSGAFRIGMYASPDATLDPSGDVVIAFANYPNGVGAGASVSIGGFDVDPRVTPGMWRVYYDVDDLGAIEETDESNNRSNVVEVEVVAAVASVEVAPATVDLSLAETAQLTAVTRDASGNVLNDRTVAWSSSDDAVATVDAQGRVTGVGAGTTTVTANSEGQAGSAEVTVTLPSGTIRGEVLLDGGPFDGAGIQIDGPASRVLVTGSDGIYEAAGLPVGTYTVTLTTVGENDFTLTVQQAEVRDGETTTVDFAGSGPPVATVDVDPSTLEIAEGATQQLTATVRSAGGSTLANRDVTWASSNASVASVDANGLLTGVSAGTATITATSEGVDGTASITVTAMTGDLEVRFDALVAATDPGGFTLTVGGVPQGSYTEGQTLTVAGLAVGDVEVTLSGIDPSSCAILEDRQNSPGGTTLSRTVTILEGQTVTEIFESSCVQAATSGVPITGLLGDLDNAFYYAIDVPSGATQLEVVTSANNGDADLYLRQGALPYRSSSPPMACGAVSSDSNEACTIPNPAAGTWYFMVFAWAPFSNLDVVATVTEGGGGSVASVDVTPANQVVFVGGTQQLTATPRDGGGAEVTGQTVSWESDNTNVATVDTNGLVTAVDVGSATITATADGTAGTAPIHVNVPVSSGFDITLEFLTPVSAQDRATFENAAARWEAIITGDIPNVNLSSGQTCSSQAVEGTIDDVHIFVTLEAIDGPFNILGSAGPCWLRGSVLPINGRMRFDTADIDRLRTSGGLNDVILHEMGHVLGVGTIWDNLSLRSADSQCGPTFDPVFEGNNAITAFNTVGGTSYTGGALVPIENGGSANDGSTCSHWRESVFDNELMSPSYNSGQVNPLSLVTIESMRDLGYSVNAGQADSYTLPGSTLRLPGGVGEVIHFGNDALPPVGIVREDGTIEWLRPKGAR